MSVRQKIKARLTTVFETLGLNSKAKTDALTDKDWSNIRQSYKQQFGTDLYEDTAKANAEERAANAELNASLLRILGSEEEKEEDENTSAEEEEESDEDENTSAEEEEEETEEEESDEEGDTTARTIRNRVTSMVKENKRLKKQLNRMSGQVQQESNRVVKGVAHNGYGLATTNKFLFGISNPLFAMDKRWNKVAAYGKQHRSTNPKEYEAFQDEVVGYGRSICSRMEQLHKEGKLNLTALTGNSIGVDYNNLSDANLGDQFVVRRQDALIARILEMPNVFGVFPLRSNIQDEELITNAFFGEFSQPYQAGEVSKGGVALEPEKAKVHKIMFKTLFESMDWLETQYIGYLNQNGSDPVKWNMIEWIILEISRVLNSERNVRYILGYRIEPVAGSNYSYLSGSTGVFHRLLSYVENLQVLPIYDEELATYSQTTMYDVVDAFVDKVCESLDSLNGKALYLNEKHKKWFADAYRTKFGKDLDFSGALNQILGRDIEIFWIPNLGNNKLMFITDKGNIQCLEFIPGEMNNIYFERRLENVWACSFWKEGTAAAYAGRKYSTAADLEASNFAEQAIFMNWPVVEATVDAAVVSVKDGILNVLGENTKAVTITDLSNATPGVVYVVYAGDVTYAPTIAKSGKFSEISAAWTPGAEGDFIKVYYDKTSSKFYEVSRKVTANS